MKFLKAHEMFQSAFPFSQAVMNIFHGMFKQTSMDQAWQHRRKLFSDEIGSRNEILKLSGEIVTLCILYESIQQCSRKKKKQKKKKMPREVKNTEEQFGIHFKGFQSLLQMKIFLRRHIILKCIEFSRIFLRVPKDCRELGISTVREI